MILMSVDLPAPLSPSTQVTSPALDLEADALQGDDAAVVLAESSTSMSAVPAAVSERRAVLACRRSVGLVGGHAHVVISAPLCWTQLLSRMAPSSIAPRKK